MTDSTTPRPLTPAQIEELRTMEAGLLGMKPAPRIAIAAVDRPARHPWARPGALAWISWAPVRNVDAELSVASASLPAPPAAESFLWGFVPPDVARIAAQHDAALARRRAEARADEVERVLVAYHLRCPRRGSVLTG